MFKLSFAAVLLASNAAVNAALNKPVLFNDGLSPHVDSSFWANLQPTQSTWSVWAAGSLPQSCRDNARSNNVNPADFEVFSVQYTDCGNPWAFCRHRSAPLSQIDMIDLFGRLPVHERQWVRHVIAVPGGGSAYMSNADVVFQGPVGTPSVFQHEVGHAVDFYKNSARSSGTSTFLNAISADTCVPDAYSNSNEVEDYTQVGVLALYDIVNPGGLNGIGANWQCLARQKSALDGFQRSDMIPGGSCVRRWADSATVPTNSFSRVRRDAVELHATMKTGFGGALPEPAAFEVKPHEFKNLVFNATEKRNAETRAKQWMKELNRAGRTA
ncbi:hypothetical protein AURDEDRAFT_110488 [Auricularia subglabra TFB-10046 SS5]|nr:hypothetical protein AURDEDRAFT_110488 [Auricularia subglabra TFB-10046 SS5]